LLWFCMVKTWSNSTKHKTWLYGQRERS